MITVAELCPFKFSKIFNNLIAHVTVLCSKKLNITKIDSGLEGMLDYMAFNYREYLLVLPACFLCLWFILKIKLKFIFCLWSKLKYLGFCCFSFHFFQTCLSHVHILLDVVWIFYFFLLRVLMLLYLGSTVVRQWVFPCDRKVCYHWL